VAAAIGDGRLAVEAIAAKVKGQDDPVLDERPIIASDSLNKVYFGPVARTVVPKLPVGERTFEAEIEGDIGRLEALREATRCLSCGNCLACDNCWVMCPDNAVIKTAELASDGSHYLFDLDFCKGCGICAQECPTGFIQMATDTWHEGD
jgi:Pyruvate/2-oxoacid:ferredoxin oxidoreductase delta subunit